MAIRLQMVIIAMQRSMMLHARSRVSKAPAMTHPEAIILYTNNDSLLFVKKRRFVSP